MKNVLAHTPSELAEAMAADGVEPYRGRQIARWVLARGVRTFEDMTDLSRELRAVLADRWVASSLECESTLLAADGTKKLVLRTGDGAAIEAVIIPEETRQTLCVSSQIGCSLDCVFCATGRLGLGRNLRADEIVDQVMHAREKLAADDRALTHVVFMGMGEPLLNLRNVVQAVRVLTDPDGVGLSPKRITVSTAGVVPKIEELGRSVGVRLAISLHATTDALRDQLVPLNKRYPIATLMEACRAYPSARRDRISFEYTLMHGVNDGDDDARRLAALVRPLGALVNLIPMNPHPGAPDLRRPPDARIDAFAGVVSRAGVNVTVRRSRGDDIFAACGQLGALATSIDSATVGSADR